MKQFNDMEEKFANIGAAFVLFLGFVTVCLSLLWCCKELINSLLK